MLYKFNVLLEILKSIFDEVWTCGKVEKIQKRVYYWVFFFLSAQNHHKTKQIEIWILFKKYTHSKNVYENSM